MWQFPGNPSKWMLLLNRRNNEPNLPNSSWLHRLLHITRGSSCHTALEMGLILVNSGRAKRTKRRRKKEAFNAMAWCSGLEQGRCIPIDHLLTLAIIVGHYWLSLSFCLQKLFYLPSFISFDLIHFLYSFFNKYLLSTIVTNQSHQMLVTKRVNKRDKNLCHDVTYIHSSVRIQKINKII